MIYDGTGNTNLLKYYATGLTTGAIYTFNLVALNFNGASDQSTDASFTVCTSPSGLNAPTVYATTETSVSFTWTAPASNGGCSITTYALYSDFGAGGSTFSVLDSSIASKPYLRADTVTLASTYTGLTFRVYLTATNSISGTV